MKNRPLLERTSRAGLPRGSPFTFCFFAACALCACDSNGRGRESTLDLGLDVPMRPYDGQAPAPDTAVHPTDIAPFDPPDGPPFPALDAAALDAATPADIGAPPTALPPLPLGRETALALIRARIRMAACIEKVHGEQANESLSLTHVAIQELNLGPMRGTRGWYRRVLECDLPELDCEGFLACVDVRHDLNCEGVTFEGLGNCITDDIRVECLIGSSWGPVTYCREQGGTCPRNNSANFGCDFGACNDSRLSHCEDDIRYVCEGAGYVASPCVLETICPPIIELSFSNFDCARHARPRCLMFPRPDQPAIAWCVGEGDACERGQPARCLDDRTVEGCSEPGYTSRLVCDDYWAGSRCVPDRGDGLGAACSFPGSECTSEQSQCVDGGLRVCIAGRFEIIDCAEFGMECRTWQPVGFPVSGCYFR